MIKGPTVSQELKSLKVLLEDFRECQPEFLPSTFATDRPEVIRAAEYFGLDLAKKDDAQYLLSILAQATFPGKGTRGRKKASKKWTEEHFLNLGLDLREVETENPGISDSEAAEKIVQRNPKYQSAGAIRSRLPAARAALNVSLIDFKGKPSDEMLSHALELWLPIWLEHADKMPREERREFLKNFNNPKVFARMLLQWGPGISW